MLLICQTIDSKNIALNGIGGMSIIITGFIYSYYKNGFPKYNKKQFKIGFGLLFWGSCFFVWGLDI